MHNLSIQNLVLNIQFWKTYLQYIFLCCIQEKGAKTSAKRSKYMLHICKQLQIRIYAVIDIVIVSVAGIEDDDGLNEKHMNGTK